MSDTVLITGSSSGIGRELARCFTRDGYSIVLTSRRRDRMEELSRELKEEFDSDVQSIECNLAAPSAGEQLCDELAKRKIEIDILVNNAGFAGYGLFDELPFNLAVDQIQVNITALTSLTRLLLPGMIARKHGAILNVASTAAFQPGPLMAVYFASKAYVLHFSEALSVELKGTGVRVTTLCPGPTESEFQRTAGMGDSKLFVGKKLPTSREVAEFGYRAFRRRKTIAIHGLSNRMLAQGYRFTTRSIIVKVVAAMQEQIHHRILPR